MSKSANKLAVLVACYNRSAMTHRVIEQILASAAESNVGVRVFVFNDGSTDDTSEKLAQYANSVTMINGPGHYFWAKSMATVEHQALKWVAEDGHLLWLNDDVDLDIPSVRNAIDTARQSPESVFVGMTTDPERPDRITYSAFKWVGPHPLRFALVQDPDGTVDAFNGNFVLVPTHIAVRMGGIDGGYTHALADIDYGVRLRSLGINIRLIPTPIGTCPRNQPGSGALRHQWSLFLGIKGGGNPVSLKRFLSQVRPKTWALWMGVTYLQWWRRALTDLVHDFFRRRPVT